MSLTVLYGHAPAGSQTCSQSPQRDGDHCHCLPVRSDNLGLKTCSTIVSAASLKGKTQFVHSQFEPPQLREMTNSTFAIT